jgi:hypothetical protein
MTMSLLHGILLTSLNDDVISGMHSPLPRDAMAEQAMVVSTVQCGAHYIVPWYWAVARRSLYQVCTWTVGYGPLYVGSSFELASSTSLMRT